jgi:NADPH:quinone reductase
MPYPRVIPHSDAVGTIDAVGHGVNQTRVGETVWVYGAQSYRPFGTAVRWTVVPDAAARRPWPGISAFRITAS